MSKTRFITRTSPSTFMKLAAPTKLLRSLQESSQIACGHSISGSELPKPSAAANGGIRSSMDDSNIKWYSMTPKLAIEEHGPIGLEEALKLVDRYLTYGGQTFKTAEEAIAATMFGFSVPNRSLLRFVSMA